MSGSKSRGTSTKVSFSSYKKPYMLTVLRPLEDSTILNQVKAKTRYIHKTFTKMFTLKGNSSKVIQANESYYVEKIIIGGFFL